MPRMSASFRSVVALAAGMLLGFGVSVGPAVKAERTVPERANAKTATALPFEDAELFAEVLERIRAEYVDEVSQQKLIEAAIRGMLSDLDPHSAYLDRAQFDEVRISTSGEYSGVGIEVTLQRGSVRVVTPIEGTPAERAGLIVLNQLDVVEVQALPRDLPDALEFDGEKLVEVGDSVTVADLIVPAGVTVKTDPTHPVATVFEPSALQAANEAAGGEAEDETIAQETEGEAESESATEAKSE